MVVDLFLVYQFIRRLATPFDKWDAYKEGIIDDKGKVLIKKKDFTNSRQRKAWGIFDIMIANLKKILGKVPGGQSRLASYAAALFLIKEYKAFTDESMLTEDLTEEDLEESLLLFNDRYVNYITEESNVKDLLIEKLKKSDDMGTWIKDFYDSDAPQFKGKSKEKRRKMAVAAKLAAMDEDGPCWDTHKQVGMKKKGNRIVPNCVPKEEADLDELSMSLKDLSKTGLNKKAYGTDKDKLKKELERLRKGLKKESLEEAAAPRWKRAGPNGEIQATVNGKKYQIEKSLDHNERHKGEWKVMVWDKRRSSWEWETTEYGKANAKAWIMDRLQEEPANNVSSGNIAGMDGSAFSKEAQKRWTSQNKSSKKKRLRDIMGDRK